MPAKLLTCPVSGLPVRRRGIMTTKRIILDNAAVLDVIAGRLLPDRRVIIAGDPLADIGCLQDPDRYLKAIIKAGSFYKNLL
jgi:hypothetical protein